MSNLQFKIIFKDIINQYNLRIISLDDSETFIVGNGFALSIGTSYEGIDVFYIISKGNQDELSVFHITNLLQDRFTIEDRKKYGNPNTKEESINAQLRVLASGLFNGWGDLLSGDKRWLNKYQLNELQANQSTVKILDPLLKK